MKSTTFFLLLIAAFLSVSCVSKKKFEASLAQHDLDKQSFENRISKLNGQITQRNQTIDSLRINLANREGANAALTAAQDKLLDRIDEVQDQLENSKKSNQNTSTNLSTTIQERESTIKAKEEKLALIQGIITKFEEDQKVVLGEFQWDLEQQFGDKQSVQYINDEIRITLDESLLFRPGQARVRTAGIQNLAKIAEIIKKYPTLKLNVIGNTDNRKPKNYKDNWDYSVIRASNVVKVLTQEYDLPTSRVLAAGKGEFSPKASNGTVEGQAANRRIDFVIAPRFDRVVKAIKKEYN